MAHWSVCHRLFWSEWLQTTLLMKVLLTTVFLPLLIVRPLALKTLHTQPVSHSDFKGDGRKDASLTKGLKGDGGKRRQSHIVI